MPTTPSLEYCSFRFLTQWQEDEEKLHHAMAGTPVPKDIRTALSYFQVSRSFKDLEDPANLAFIAEALLRVRDQGSSSPSEKVNQLANDFRVHFDRFNLSAASKLLWLTHRKPFVIYDSRAVEALASLSPRRFNYRDYKAYDEVWHEEYQKVEDAVRDAAIQLPKARPFMRSALHQSDQELLRMTTEPWFMERVFDIFLWELGG